jgi:hypothetical protein
MLRLCPALSLLAACGVYLSWLLGAHRMLLSVRALALRSGFLSAVVVAAVAVSVDFYGTCMWCSCLWER